MKFEDLEATWAQQPAPPVVDLDALQRSLKAQLGRRQRMLILAGAGAVIGLIAMQLIFFVNLQSVPPANPWVSFGRLALHQGISLVLLIEIVRVYLRHRRLARSRAASLREVVDLSVVSVEAEMADYRMAGWIVPVLMAHSFLSIYLNHMEGVFGWSGLGPRVASVVAVYGLIGLLCAWHYRRVLQPRHEELRARLAELEQG